MKYLFAFLIILSNSSAWANGLETSMHAAGKMNVTLGVIAIIFAGIIVYLFLLDRKLSRMEKEIKQRKS